MKNKNAFVFYVLLLFCAGNSYCVWESVGANAGINTLKEGERVANRFVQKNKPVLKEFTAKATEASKNAGIEAAKKIVDCVDNHADRIDMPNLGKHAAETLAKSLDRAVFVGVGVAAGALTYVAYREIKQACCYLLPSAQERLRAKEASRKIDIIKAEEKLYTCLIDHVEEEKNGQGLPCACEQISKNYASFAGFAALGAIIKEFKEVTTDLSPSEYQV